MSRLLSWPELIVDRTARYRRVHDLHLVRALRGKDPEGRPLPPPSLPDDVVPLHSYRRVMVAGRGDESSCECCCCTCRCATADASSQTSTGRPPRSPASAVEHPPLNRPRGNAWVRGRPRSSASGEERLRWLPAYEHDGQLFAVDLGAPLLRAPVLSERERSELLQHVRREIAAPQGRRVTRLDLSTLAQRLERATGLHPLTVELAWIPAASPAADGAASISKIAPNWHRAWCGFATLWPLDAQDRVVEAAIIDVDIEKHEDFEDGSLNLVGLSSVSEDIEDGFGFAAADGVRSYNAHGTCTAGIIIAQDRQDLSALFPETIGVAPRGTLLHAYDVRDWSVASIRSALTDAVHSAEKAIRVISLSFAYYKDRFPKLGLEDMRELEELLYAAHHRGILVCAAAGNLRFPDGAPERSAPTIGFPACDPHVIAVGAIDAEGRRCWAPGHEAWGACCGPWSLRGLRKGVTVVAPGTGIMTTDMTNGMFRSSTDRENFNGTSAATPQVAALALQLFRRYTLTHTEVRTIIEATAEKLSAYEFDWVSGCASSTYNDEVGYGCIRADWAVDYADVEIEATIQGGNLSVGVKNRGPAPARGVKLYAWDLGSEPRRWALTRNDSSEVVQYELAGLTPWIVDVGSLKELPASASFQVPHGHSILVLAHADNDYGFHNTFPNKGERTIYARAGLAYNNLRVVREPPM